MLLDCTIYVLLDVLESRDWHVLLHRESYLVQIMRVDTRLHLHIDEIHLIVILLQLFIHLIYPLDVDSVSFRVLEFSLKMLQIELHGFEISVVGQV